MVPPVLTWNALFLAAALVAAAYLIGSIPTAYLVVRRRRGQDIRRLGDGNSGAENVGHVLGLKAGVSVAALDTAKGLAVILLARLLAPDYYQGLAMLAGVAAVIGHSWPLYLRGPGGRGAATAVGVLLGMTPLTAGPVLLPALGIAYLSRSVTRGLATFFIGNAALAGVFGYYHLFSYPWSLVGYVIILPVLVGIIHYLSTRRKRPAAASTVSAANERK